MIRWIKKKLGYHVCENFTKWERIVDHFTRPPRANLEVITANENLRKGNGYIVTFTEIFQQRRCLDCGKIQQEKLEY